MWYCAYFSEKRLVKLLFFKIFGKVLTLSHVNKLEKETGNVLSKNLDEPDIYSWLVVNYIQDRLPPFFHPGSDDPLLLTNDRCMENYPRTIPDEFVYFIGTNDVTKMGDVDKALEWLGVEKAKLIN